MPSKRTSTPKKNVERHDRAKWWFVQSDEGIFIKKSTGRAKSNGEELPAVNDISASQTKSESLKVRKIDMLYRFYCNCNGK